MIIKLEKIEKVFGKGNSQTIALKDINLQIDAGEFLVILGASGSGKSTLLNIISTIDQADQGTISFKEQDITKLKNSEKTVFRRKNIGFIFQQYHLLDGLTVKENVKVGAYLDNNQNVDSIISSLGLIELKDKYPYELSGGQQQRVAIARAISKNPSVLICDEPTGALDEETGKTVLSYLERINKEKGTTIIMVTHSPGIANMASKIIKMNSGKIISEVKNTERVAAQEVYWG